MSEKEFLQEINKPSRTCNKCNDDCHCGDECPSCSCNMCDCTVQEVV